MCKSAAWCLLSFFMLLQANDGLACGRAACNFDLAQLLKITGAESADGKFNLPLFNAAPSHTLPILVAADKGTSRCVLAIPNSLGYSAS